MSARQRDLGKTPILILGLTELSAHHGALGMVRSAGRMGVPIFHAHEGRRSWAGASRYSSGGIGISKRATDEERLELLLELSHEIGRAVLVAVDDSGAVFVEEHRDALQERFLFPQQPQGLVGSLTSKRGLQALCLEHGVPTAQCAFPSSEDELLTCLQTMELPLMIKRVAPLDPSKAPAPSVLIARDLSELRESYELLADVRPYGEGQAQSNVMVQEHIPGGPDSSWMFDGYFDRDGACQAAFTGIQLRQSPPDTGATTLGVCRPNEEVAGTTIDFMKALGYRGMIDVDYRLDSRDGRYKLLDVNPRIGATFRLFVDPQGIDVLRAMYLDLTDAPVTAGTPKTGRRWIAEPLDLRSSVIYMGRKELTFKAWLDSLKGVEETAWWARDDRRPLPAVFIRLISARLRRMFRR